jgi:pyrophosphate--fructose-6-phosphate 1-phosphotransferase
MEREMSGSIKLSQIETEKLLAHFCQVELAKRKSAGKYSGAFAAVTHFFGYQGRSALPTSFDCSLGSTCGFGAAVLIENGRNAMAVSVSELTLDPSQWRVGGVPLLALVQSSKTTTEFGRNNLQVPGEEVNL